MKSNWSKNYVVAACVLKLRLVSATNRKLTNWRALFSLHNSSRAYIDIKMAQENIHEVVENQCKLVHTEASSPGDKSLQYVA